MPSADLKSSCDIHLFQFIDIGGLVRAGVQSLSFGIAIDQLDQRHRCRIAVAKASPQNSRVAPGPIDVAISERGKKLVCELGITTESGNRLPPGMQAVAGDFVAVPLGGRIIPGVVWGASEGDGVAESRLKDVEAVLPVPPLPAMNRAFIDWMSGYVLAPPGAVDFPNADSPWASRQLWMAHAAVSRDEAHVVAERLSRGSPEGLAG